MGPILQVSQGLGIENVEASWESSCYPLGLDYQLKLEECDCIASIYRPVPCKWMDSISHLDTSERSHCRNPALLSWHRFIQTLPWVHKVILLDILFSGLSGRLGGAHWNTSLAICFSGSVGPHRWSTWTCRPSIEDLCRPFVQTGEFEQKLWSPYYSFWENLVSL